MAAPLSASLRPAPAPGLALIATSDSTSALIDLHEGSVVNQTARDAAVDSTTGTLVILDDAGLHAYDTDDQPLWSLSIDAETTIAAIGGVFLYLNRPRCGAVSFRVWKEDVDYAEEDPGGDETASDPTGGFSLAEAVEPHGDGASGQALGSARHPEHVARPGEQEAAGAAVTIDRGLDGEEQSGSPLHLVDREQPRPGLRDEFSGITDRRGAHIIVIQGDDRRRLRARELAGERALPDLTRTFDHDSRERLHRFGGESGDVPLP